MAQPDLSDLSPVGTVFSVRVTPRAASNRITRDGDDLRVYVTTAPEDGKATASVQKLLAKSIGVAKSRLVLLTGAASRVKTFRVE